MKIGLTQRILYYKGRAHDSIEHNWYNKLTNHTIVPIANKPGQDLHSLANNIDVLIITGGDADPIRTNVELNLVANMVTLQKPIIGVCHGCFLLTKLLRGEIQSIDNHMDLPHEIIYKQQRHIVNSYHTVCITNPPKNATVLAVDPDGHCEAWILGNIAGVVWHPERLENFWLPHRIATLIED
jgi:gamma-glutamyl-gamma-aminobutyrate hydrolase PuuD